MVRTWCETRRRCCRGPANDAQSRGDSGASNGSLRVRVFAGEDPVTRKRHYVSELVPPGPRARREAERVRTKLLAQVQERRRPSAGATVATLMERSPTQRHGFRAQHVGRNEVSLQV